MFEIVFSIMFLLALFVYKIPSMILLVCELRSNTNFSERKDEKFNLFCEGLKQEMKSTLVDKKGIE